MTNHLYYGDNLAVLRDSIAYESVDLIYLDPPFNSNASYNVLFKGPKGNESAAQIEAFDDTWHWGEESELAYADVRGSDYQAAADMLTAMYKFLGKNDMMAYLTMMAVRLIELHRVLKPGGRVAVSAWAPAAQARAMAAPSPRAAPVANMVFPLKELTPNVIRQQPSCLPAGPISRQASPHRRTSQANAGHRQKEWMRSA